MQQNQLGHTDIYVSKICLGTMTFGEQNTAEEGHAQLDYALDHGINFVDTAEMYAIPARKETQGSTERIIGSWIKTRRNRDKFILATKVTGPSAMTWINHPLTFQADSIHTAIDGSLKRLQTDYVDLYQLHWPERTTNYFGQRGYRHREQDKWEDNFLEVIQTLQQLIKAGKIRHWGLSNETPWGTMRCIALAEQHGLPRPVSIQNPYCLLNRTFEIGLSEISIREQVGLLAYSPLGFGVLSGKYVKGIARKSARVHQFPRYNRYSNEQAVAATKKYLAIAEENDMTLAQMSLAFVNDRRFMTTNIIGATSVQQLEENISSANITLSKEVLKAIEAVHESIPNPAP